MLYNLLIYLAFLLITVDLKSSFQIINNQTTGSSVSVQTAPDNLEIRLEGLLNVVPKRAENLSNDQLLILRNILVNSNNLNLEDTNILSTANNLEFAIMSRQLNIVIQPELSFNPTSQLLLHGQNFSNSNLENNPILENQRTLNNPVVNLQVVG